MMNFAVLLLLLAAFTFGCYTLWDTNQIFEEAYASNYAAYKPEAQKDNLSYDELVRRNPDVLGWLSIYGTGIDYPLVQAADNDLYLNRNALGEVSMPGSLFLDYRNQRGFQDFNTIIYGHHMEKSAMFGDISKFSEQQYFEERRYGDIYYGNVHYGLEILAILQCSAFNNGIYNPAVEGEGGEIGVPVTSILTGSTPKNAGCHTMGPHRIIKHLQNRTYRWAMDSSDTDHR